jgi:hypothetical protein
MPFFYHSTTNITPIFFDVRPAVKTGQNRTCNRVIACLSSAFLFGKRPGLFVIATQAGPRRKEDLWQFESA